MLESTGRLWLIDLLVSWPITWLIKVDVDGWATKLPVLKPEFAGISGSGGVSIGVIGIRANELTGSVTDSDPNKSISKLLAAGGVVADYKGRQKKTEKKKENEDRERISSIPTPTQIFTPW